MSGDGPAERPANPEHWTDAQWEDWFSEEVAPTDRWGDHVDMTYRRLGVGDPSIGTETAGEHEEAFEELTASGEADEVTMRVARLTSSPSAGPLASMGLIENSRASEFSRLSRDLKLDFYRSWTQPSPSPDTGRIEDAPYPEEASGSWQKWAVPVAVAGVILGWVVLGGDDEGGPGDTTSQAAATDDDVVAACGEAAPPADTSEWTCTATFADDAVVTVTYPATAEPGAPFRVTLCSQTEGELFATLGNDPGDPSASHANGSPGSDGCTQVNLDVNDTSGTTTLWTAATDRDAVVVDDGIGIGSTPTASGQADGAASDCEAARQQQHTMTFASPEIPDGGPIPEMYIQDAWELGLPSPAVTWSGVPEATTELAIVAVSHPDGDPELLTADDPWRPADPANGIESGIAWSKSERWIVTGIDPGLTGLEQMTYFEALDAGLELHPHIASSELDGEPVYGFFHAPDGVGPYTVLFTLFALCEPDHDRPDAYSGSWFTQQSITYATFGAAG